jgi:hypothetical protein
MRLEDLLPKLTSFIPFGLYKTSSEYIKERYEHLGAEINEKTKKEIKKSGVRIEIIRDLFSAGVLYFTKEPKLTIGFYLILSYILDRTAYYGLPFNLRNKKLKNFFKDK